MALKRLKRAFEAFFEAVPPATVSCRRVDRVTEYRHMIDERAESIRKIHEWLPQRQAFIDDHYNGPPQSMVEVIAQSKADLALDLSLNRVMPEDHIRHAHGAQYEWDEDLGEFVLK